MKEAPGSSETSVLTRATRRNNPEDTILLNLLALKPISTVAKITIFFSLPSSDRWFFIYIIQQSLLVDEIQSITDGYKNLNSIKLLTVMYSTNSNDCIGMGRVTSM
jgi:hypothetical protein